MEEIEVLCVSVLVIYFFFFSLLRFLHLCLLLSKYSYNIAGDLYRCYHQFMRITHTIFRKYHHLSHKYHLFESVDALLKM